MRKYISLCYRGLEVTCNGYSPELGNIFLESVQDSLCFHRSISKEKLNGTFRIVKEKYVRALKSCEISSCLYMI